MTTFRHIETTKSQTSTKTTVTDVVLPSINVVRYMKSAPDSPQSNDVVEAHIYLKGAEMPVMLAGETAKSFKAAWDGFCIQQGGFCGFAPAE